MKGRILVFGATGYIGRYLCCRLKEMGREFVAIGRSNVVADFFKMQDIPLVRYDLENDGEFDHCLNVNSDDAIVNLAACLAEHETPVKRFFDVNTIGTYRLLDLARRNGVRKYVMTTSHKVYNDVDTSDGHMIVETEALKYHGPHTPYIISKVAAENFVTYYSSDFGIRGVCLRLTGVHGYGEILGHLDVDGHYRKSAWDVFFERALIGAPIEIWGDQKIKRDHVYVKDVVSAIIAAVDAEDVSGIFNIATGVGYSQYEEACALAEVFATTQKSKVVCRPELLGLSRGYVYDISKAKEYLNWKPEFTDLVKMYRDYKKEWLLKRFCNYHHIVADEAPKNV